MDRETLLRQLESVQPGTALKDTVEQSTCFCFQNGQVATYNGEVACFHDCPLDITGAVPAAPFLLLLQKMSEEEVDVEVQGAQLHVIGRKRRAKLNMEAEVVLPIDNVEPPKKWKALHDEFIEAVQMVQECAREKAEEFEITCVHITPEWVEAHDNYQMARYTLATGFKEPFLVKRDSLKHIVALGMTEYSETDSWVHFRNPMGVRISCQRHAGEYKDLSFLTQVTGAKTKLPKGLGEAVERATIFSDEKTGGTGLVKVSLKEGKIRVTGKGLHGEFSEVKSLKYAGPPRSFVISPKLLIEITKKFSDCCMSESLLNVTGGSFVFSACLGDASEVE